MPRRIFALIASRFSKSQRSCSSCVSSKQSNTSSTLAEPVAWSCFWSTSRGRSPAQYIAHSARSFFGAVQIQIEGVELPVIGRIPGSLIQMVPYVVTVIVLAGLMAKSVAPKAIGKPFVKSR